MSKTLKLNADVAADIERAAQILRDGGTVAFPTETVYGLGADALNTAAVAKVFEAKLRPFWDPLIVHVPAAEALSQLTILEEETRRRVDLLAKSFWPGPLTLLLPKLATVPHAVTAGRPLVGVRVPSHPVAQKLLRLAGIPIAAPSANTFGHISPTTAGHVLSDLEGRINAVLDGGSTTVGLESTVVDPTQTPIVLYRPGAVTPEEITLVTGIEVEICTTSKHDEAQPQSLPSPGVGIRHYAPRAQVILIEGDESTLRDLVAGVKNAGILVPNGWAVDGSAIAEKWGSWNNPAELALNLFACLRALDEHGVAEIFCPLPPAGGISDATRDRLQKAARPA